MTIPNANQAVTTKKIASVEVLFLDNTGYGPEGKHTRREWRAECLQHFEQGAEDFLAWQQSLQTVTKQSLLSANFNVELRFDDGSVEIHYRADTTQLIDFTGHVFEQSVRASDYQFLQDVSFSAATFKATVTFVHTTFIRPARFESATFTGSAFFDRASFIEGAVFTNATFKSTVTFLDAVFRAAHFSNATFENYALFDNNTFENYANFSNTTFKKIAAFNNSTFKCSADFSNSTFKGDSSFFKIKFHNQSHFKKVSFEGSTDFENAQFDNVGHFEGACFDAPTAKIPTFRGVKIDSTRLEFSDDTYFTRTDFTEDAIKNISFLKRLADEHGQTDQALNFNAMELRAKRKYQLTQMANLAPFDFLVSSDWWNCAFTWIYEYVSDFGRSFIRPFWYLCLLTGFTWFIASFQAGNHSPPQCPNTALMDKLARDNRPCGARDSKEIYLTGYRAAVEYSLYRATGLLDFSDADKHTETMMQRLFGQPIEPWWMRIWGVFKAIASTALLFLAALGLRNKYRIK